MDKSTLHVGGLPKDISPATLHDLFIPFGDIRDIHLPPNPDTDPKAPPYRGFAFIEFAEREDALAAIDNMHLSEINGWPIKVEIAKEFRYQDLGNRAVWTDEAWLKDQGYIKQEEDKERAIGSDIAANTDTAMKGEGASLAPEMATSVSALLRKQQQ